MSEKHHADRRELLLATASIGGLVAAAAVPQLARAGEEQGPPERPRLRDVVEKMKVLPDKDKRLERLYGARGTSPIVLERLADGFNVIGRPIELAVRELSDGRGRVFGHALSATVPANGVFPLSLDGQPFVVTRFSCSFDRIAWQAGNGWPVYSTRCPTHEYAPGMLFRDAFEHQIVPWLKGVGYGLGCDNRTVYDFGKPGQLHVGVNDDRYEDNQGTFDIMIYNFS